MTLNDVLFATLVLLNLADIESTLRGLESGAQERNPFLKRLFAGFGVEAVLLPLKWAVIGTVGYFQYKHGALDWMLLAFLNGVYAFVVLNNWRVVRKQRG